MKNLIISITFICGILLGMLGLSFYRHMFPWQRKSLDYNYSQAQGSKKTTFDYMQSQIDSDKADMASLTQGLHLDGVDTSKTRNWDDIEKSQDYQKLTPQEQHAAKAQFFTDVILKSRVFLNYPEDLKRYVTNQFLYWSFENKNNISKSSNIELKEFLQVAFTAMDSYRLGNNKFLDGLKSSKAPENNFGDITQLDLSNKIYEAKGYFEKMINDINLLEGNDSNINHVKKLLIQAAQTRVDGINLITKGLLLKQERGQIRLNNMIHMASESNASMSGTAILEQQGSQTALPLYNGEIEAGYGKIKSANLYFVDAIRTLKTYTKQFPTDRSLTYPDFDDYLNYYSDV